MEFYNSEWYFVGGEKGWSICNLLYRRDKCYYYRLVCR